MADVTTATFVEQHLDRAMIEVEAALRAGTDKHGAGLKPKMISLRIKSSQNHIGKYEAGSDRDDESGVLHLVAATIQLLIASQHLITKPKLDDRQKKKNLMNDSEMYEFMKKGEPVNR